MNNWICTLVGCIHGDKLQGDRTSIMQSFKVGELPILVATDVAGKLTDAWCLDWAWWINLSS